LLYPLKNEKKRKTITFPRRSCCWKSEKGKGGVYFLTGEGLFVPALLDLILTVTEDAGLERRGGVLGLFPQQGKKKKGSRSPLGEGTSGSRPKTGGNRGRKRTTSASVRSGGGGENSLHLLRGRGGEKVGAFLPRSRGERKV